MRTVSPKEESKHEPEEYEFGLLHEGHGTELFNKGYEFGLINEHGLAVV